MYLVYNNSHHTTVMSLLSKLGPIAFIFTIITGYCSGSSIDAFILNGNEANEADYPWQLSFQRRVNGLWFHTCGATLINESYALTASHCVYNRHSRNENGTFDPYEVRNMRVVAGAHRLSSSDTNAESHFLQKVITPFGLNRVFDVAVLKLRVPANTSRPDISVIAIAENTDDWTGRTCFVTGWGTVSVESRKFTPILREASMTVINHKDCNRTGWEVSRYQTCATGNPREVTTCFGDSGGPLTCTRDDGTPILVGVSSYVYAKCQTIRPNVFAKISAYRKWLQRLTNIIDI